MDYMPIAFCCRCYEKVPYTMDFSEELIEYRGIRFRYIRTKAICKRCGEEIYAAPVNDKNWYERHQAYYKKLEELGRIHRT